MNNDTRDLLKCIDTENISEVLSLYSGIEKMKSNTEDVLNELNVIIKLYLKKRKWNHYKDNKTGVSISLELKKTKKCDWTQAHILIKPSVLNQITKKEEQNILQVITMNTNKKLKKILKK